MAETSKNKIYYNDNENSVADVLADMKKMAESTDKAIENSKYNDAAIKKNISDIEEKQSIKDSEQDSKIVELQNEKAKLEKELKEAQEDFYQASIRGQASGEYIHVEDSSNCRSIIGISGNHEQETRSGKNYLNTLAKYKAGDTVTIEGITYTFNNDGSITCNGTASATANSNLDFSVDAQKINGTNKKIVGLLTGSQVPSKMALTAYTSTWGANPTLTFSEVNKSLTINMQSNAEYTIFRISVYRGTTVNNQTVYYQILDTSETDLTYEQYGVSPSPDYPSEIESVGSNINLLENTLKSQIINGIDVKVQDNGEIVLNGTATDNFALVIGKINKIKNMTFGGMCDGYGYSKMIAQIQGTDYNVNVVNSNKVALSDLDTEATVRLYIYKGAIITNAIIKPKIVEGTEVGEYSKYGQGCVKVTKCNKNILKNIATSGALNGVTRTVNEEKSVTINGTSTGWANLTVGTIKGDGNSYTLSGSLSNSEIFLSVNNSQEGDIAQSKNGNEITFIPKRGLTYNVIICIPSGKTFNNVLIKPLVRISSDKDNTYEQHEEQSYIMPVQKEMLQGDYFDFDNEEEVHIWNKLALTGDEEIMYSIAQGDYYLFQIRKNDAMRDIPFVCNKFINASNWGVANSRESINNQYNNGTLMQFKVLSSRLSETSAKGVKLWLKAQYDAETPVMIYYKLQTPTRLAFTDEQKAVAKELNNARTYKNVTNITTDSKAILSLDYAKDLETLLNNTQALAVNNASEGV